MAAPMRKLCSRQILKRCVNLSHRCCAEPTYEARHYADASSAPISLAERLSNQLASLEKKTTASPKAIFRTDKTDPNDHTLDQEGLYYRVQPEIYEAYVKPGQDIYYKKQVKTFQEACVMVRKPAMEIIDVMKKVNYDHPPVKVLMHSSFGNGKSMTMAHVIHHCTSNDWIICHVPYVGFWMKWFKEWNFSTFNPDRVDLPLMSSDWLAVFKQQNSHLLKDLVTTKEYRWSKQEKAEEGIPLINIVDFGLERSKYSNDCVCIVLRELRRAATEKKCKILVAIDGVNGFFRDTLIRHELRYIPASELSLVCSFKKMLQPTWNNGFVVSTVDIASSPKEQREDHSPLYLLQEEGFHFMDPFLPIQVDRYSEKEVHSCLEYYIDRRWILKEYGKTEEGKKELIFLSNKNPRELMKICAAW